MNSRTGIRSRPVEMTGDPAFALRIKRLGTVSAIVPGIIWWLAATRLTLPEPLLAALAAGWWLMPAVLWASMPLPALRPLLVVPSALLTLPTLMIVVRWLPPAPLPALGWLSIATGLLMGGLLGIWFWFRWAPVPVALDAPFSPGRWTLIAIHVAFIVAGIVLVFFG